MTFDKEKYLDRLVDKKIELYLKVLGAISIEGPKWCGKTWTSLKHSNSVIELDNPVIVEKMLMDPNLVLNEEKPELIDEWNIVPEVWDAVRRKCDQTEEKGNYILTCSTKLKDEEAKQKIHHSGAGRIGKIKMYTMSLYESKESTGKVSIKDMYEGKFVNGTNTKIDIENIANCIIRGGWPSNLTVDEQNANVIPQSYIENILDFDINDDKKRDKKKMLLLLRSLARNESSIVNKKTIIKDIEVISNNDDLIESRVTLDDYLDVLDRLHIIDNQESYSTNYRSPLRVSKTAKSHFIDPSLACAVLKLNKEKLLNDPKTFGIMFEALAVRDLRIYMESLNGKIYHFRDNVTGLESDAVLEFENGDYALVEIKLSIRYVEEAKKNLINLYNKMEKKPSFMCIVVANLDVFVKDKETGIYIVPLTALMP